MGAQVKNPRKKFLWSIKFVKHPLNPYLFQNVQLPEITVEQVTHGDINRDVKTAGRVSIGNLSAQKLMTTDGSDTWLWDWINACQDHILGGGLTPSQYWETAIVSELAEDGKSVLNSWYVDEIWPTRVNGLELSRVDSENSIEDIEFSVGTIDKV
jgi:hypothetical protein